MERVDKRQAILEAAAKRFSTNGFHETKVGEIAEDAGIAKGTVYLHFKDKETLLSEVVHYQMVRYHRYICEAIEPYESATDKLRAFARFQISAFPQMIKFYKLNFEHMMKFKENSRLAERQTEQHRQMMETIIDVIRYGIERGEFREMDATDAALILRGTMHAYMQSAISGVVAEKDQAGADALVNLLIQGFAPSCKGEVRFDV
ncbi:hypothetical protein CIG75_03310 [Tumebacillus algifaecis]|uniref:HTH tetR-type domain-containing protein n=1 Tax=Tumebacillus algifaecis TaxID=1214604 RepID=A0A223CXT5_9BACL|nr:TetR/AcrR family transcriptional regulator [Tumebacillus algifaecis]ASS74111.1 hypothetical protein CIG75_03310 [Tumebacillus algifaecis]